MTEAIGRRRWGIGLLLGAGVLINYFDRINLSVAGPELSREFGLNATELGLLFSAYAWTYAALQIPTGVVLDRLGVKLVGRVATLLWGVASALTAIAPSYGLVFASRLLLGVAEAPSFPANAKAVGLWFPRRERALATALFDAAAKFSNVIGVPAVALAITAYGWRWGFAITAVLSRAYGGVCGGRYRDPREDRHLGAAERALIRSGGAVPEGASELGGGALLAYLLGRRKVWGLTLGFMAYGYSFYLFLTWLPGYLVQTMHMNILRSAGLAAIPWACATVSDLLVGGWLIDRLIARGYPDSLVRKTVLVGGMLTGLAVFGATRTTDPRWAIAWISIALSGLAAAAPVGWSLPGLIAPRGGTGTIGGIMNFANNAMAIAAPIATGAIVTATGSFEGAFAVAGVILLLGIASFTLLLGRLEPIPEPPGSRPPGPEPAGSKPPGPSGHG